MILSPVRGLNETQWRANRLHGKTPSLYVEIGLEQVVQRTRIVKRNLTPVWDEDLVL